jgi:hypothetical protein
MRATTAKTKSRRDASATKADPGTLAGANPATASGTQKARSGGRGAAKAENRKAPVRETAATNANKEKCARYKYKKRPSERRPLQRPSQTPEIAGLTLKTEAPIADIKKDTTASAFFLQL